MQTVRSLLKYLLLFTVITLAMLTLQKECLAQIRDTEALLKEEKSYLERLVIEMRIFEAPNNLVDYMTSSVISDSPTLTGLREVSLDIAAEDQLHGGAQKRLYMGGEKELRWFLENMKSSEELGELEMIAYPSIMTFMWVSARLEQGLTPRSKGYHASGATTINGDNLNLLLEMRGTWMSEEHAQWQLELRASIKGKAEVGIDPQQISINHVFQGTQFILLQGLCRNSELDRGKLILTKKCLPIYVLLKPTLIEKDEPHPYFLEY